MKSQFPAAALRACSRCGVVPSRYFLAVNIARQSTALFYRRDGFYVPAKTFRCSTSMYGIGEVAGSNRTPRGLHRVAQKIGGGWPVGVAFKSRQVIGFTWQGQPLAPIAHRILWLEGLEPGLNRGGNVDSRARYIYIHGTGNEATLGRPDSHGCIHLSSDDLLPLYDKLPEGTLV
jgi:lipoprotein-anchoring transpeptidase ErfK/SrfK